MKSVAIILAAIILISGCHPTVYLKTDDESTNADKMSSGKSADYTMAPDSAYSYDVSEQMIYPYLEGLDEIMLAQNQADANLPIPQPPDGNEPNTAQPPAQEPEDEPSDSIRINMTASMTFEPDSVSVNIGQTVVWTNRSELVHTVTSDPSMAKSIDNVGLPGGAEPWDSGDIAPGKTYAMTFAVAGTYKYFCKYYELAGMLGQVTVMPLNQ